MATIKPFRALRPTKEFAEQVSCVPYDVVSTDEARTLAKDKPHSFLRVIRSEIEFGPDKSAYDDAVYSRAKENFAKLIGDGILVQEAEPAIYVYQIQMGSHVQTGVVACSAVDDYDRGVVKLHEKTRPVKENDRTKHILTIGAQSGPVFLAYKSDSRINTLVESVCSTPPEIEVCAEDGVAHRIWKVTDYASFCSAFDSIACTYVADGHHRAASASRARAELRRTNEHHNGNEDYNFFLSVLFPHDQLQILPYNRVITQTGLSADQIITEISHRFEIEPGASTVPPQKGELRMYLQGVWYALRPKSSLKLPHGDPVEALDVSLLQREILEPVFGIDDPRTSDAVEFIGGIRGTEELERLVNSGIAHCAFSLHHVSIEELFAIADAGLMMAPKSTWFEPKLRSGLLIHRFESGN